MARTFNAPIARITADYALGFLGQGKAVSDANAGALPWIDVEPIDLRPARRFFLVSPTWMFRPATPLWAYVEQTDLSDKEIVLVTTGNSRFKQAEIDAFAKRVHGGRLVHHAFLRRGRVYWQVSREDLFGGASYEATQPVLIGGCVQGRLRIGNHFRIGWKASGPLRSQTRLKQVWA